MSDCFFQIRKDKVNGIYSYTCITIIHNKDATNGLAAQLTWQNNLNIVQPSLMQLYILHTLAPGGLSTLVLLDMQLHMN